MKVIKFSKNFCPPCAAYEPVFEKTVGQYDNLIIEYARLESSPMLFQMYGVASVPTTIVVDDEGNLLEGMVWPLDEEMLKWMIDKHL